MMDDDEALSNAELQLSELEMLQAMFPEDVTVLDPASEADLRSRIRFRQYDGFQSDLLTYELRLKPFGEQPETISVQVKCPRSYPSRQGPEVYLISGQLSRQDRSSINSVLQTYVSSLELGELMMSYVVSWVQENGADYCSKKTNNDQEETAAPRLSAKNAKDLAMTRFWLYSHHIYSKVKRRNILQLASDFKLTGFCMPGMSNEGGVVIRMLKRSILPALAEMSQREYCLHLVGVCTLLQLWTKQAGKRKPGIICLEGHFGDCSSAWSAIKSWNWKKINMRTQEDGPLLPDSADTARRQWRKFDGFEEVGMAKPSERRDYHMDMGEFFNYLQEHDCDHMFKELFGIEKS